MRFDPSSHLGGSPQLRQLVERGGVPGIGPIIAAVILSELDGIGRFPTAKKLLGYAGLAPTTSSSGGKTYHGKMIRSCNKWLKWAFVEAAWVTEGCNPYFGGIYRKASVFPLNVCPLNLKL